MHLRVVPDGLVRVLLFKRASTDPIDLRLALSMSQMPCETRVFDQTSPGVDRAGKMLRSGDPVPSLVLFDQEEREGLSMRVLSMIRNHPQLRALPIVVLGDGRVPGIEGLARQDGASGFIARPERDSDLRRAGVDIAQFWTRFRRPESA